MVNRVETFHLLTSSHTLHHHHHHNPNKYTQSNPIQSNSARRITIETMRRSSKHHIFAFCFIFSFFCLFLFWSCNYGLTNTNTNTRSQADNPCKQILLTTQTFNIFFYFSSSFCYELIIFFIIILYFAICFFSTVANFAAAQTVQSHN